MPQREGPVNVNIIINSLYDLRQITLVLAVFFSGPRIILTYFPSPWEAQYIELIATAFSEYETLWRHLMCSEFPLLPTVLLLDAHVWPEREMSKARGTFYSQRCLFLNSQLDRVSYLCCGLYLGCLMC